MSPIPPSATGVVGQQRSTLETPVLVADIETMDANMREYGAVASDAGVKLRTHSKAHKIPEIARWQADTTDAGILCQTLSEAELMAAHGLDDIYLSYMVVEDSKLRRLVSLAATLDYFATTVDGPGNIDPLAEMAAATETPVDVILEIDIGLNRVGVDPGDEAVQLANYIDDHRYLRFAGVMGYEGHIGYGADPATAVDEYESRCQEAMDLLSATVDQIEQSGLSVDEVMAGSTATARYSAQHPTVTEIHPGMFLFNDANLCSAAPTVTKADCAATVLTTVISTPTDDRAVVDGGSKTFSLDIDQLPVPKHRSDITYHNASEEHGWIDTSQATDPINVGDTIEFIVPHVCTTINLHEQLIGTRNDKIERIWDIKGRGKLR